MTRRAGRVLLDAAIILLLFGSPMWAPFVVEVLL